jgi:hypothetical protein
VVTVYEQVAGRFGRPVISEMRGELAAPILPAARIDWARVLSFPGA